MTDPFTQSAAQGLTTLQEYGLAGLFLSLLIIGSIFVLRYFMNDCQKRHEDAVNMWKEDAKLNRDSIDKNTEAFHGVQLALVKLEVKLEK